MQNMSMKELLQGLELIFTESEGNVLQNRPMKELKNFLEQNVNESEVNGMED